MAKHSFVVELTFNVTNTELIFFYIFYHRCKFKLDGKQLTSTNTVKYLDVFLDEHLLWSKQLNYIKAKLNPAIGILIKLRNNLSEYCLKYLPENDI